MQLAPAEEHTYILCGLQNMCLRKKGKITTPPPMQFLPDPWNNLGEISAPPLEGNWQKNHPSLFLWKF